MMRYLIAVLVTKLGVLIGRKLGFREEGVWLEWVAAKIARPLK